MSSSNVKPSLEDDNWFENERLHRAAAEGDLVEMRRLLACGYKLDVFDDLGHTPLHCAVKGEHYKAAEWLLREGANVDAHDEAKIGETPLGLAARGEYPQIVELLLKSGANPDITGWMAHTARSRAARIASSTSTSIRPRWANRPCTRSRWWPTALQCCATANRSPRGR